MRAGRFRASTLDVENTRPTVDARFIVRSKFSVLAIHHHFLSLLRYSTTHTLDLYLTNMLRTALCSSRCSLRQARCFSSSSPFSTSAGTEEDKTPKTKKDEPEVESINLDDITKVIAKEFKHTQKESREILDCAFSAIERVSWLDM